MERKVNYNVCWVFTETNFTNSKVEENYSHFSCFQNILLKALGLHLKRKTRDWRQSYYISPHLVYSLSLPFKALCHHQVPSAMQEHCRDCHVSPCCQRPEDWDFVSASQLQWLFFPCSERSYSKERGRWMSGPCIWHLISATSDLGFDWASLSESLRKQSLLSSLNKFMPWCMIYLLWQFYYSEQWAFLVPRYFGFSFSSHVYKGKHSVW